MDPDQVNVWSLAYWTHSRVLVRHRYDLFCGLFSYNGLFLRIFYYCLVTLNSDGPYGPCAVMLRGKAGVQSGYSGGTLRVQWGYSQGTAGEQWGYSKGTAGGTVRVQQGTAGGTVRVQQGYSRGTVVVVVVVDHISLGDPFMFSMNRPIIFCCAILLCNGL